MLKQSVQWRPQQLPQLITTLQKLVQLQHDEADRAMYGRGDLEL